MYTDWLHWNLLFQRAVFLEEKPNFARQAESCHFPHLVYVGEKHQSLCWNGPHLNENANLKKKKQIQITLHPFSRFMTSTSVDICTTMFWKEWEGKCFERTTASHAEKFHSHLKKFFDHFWYTTFPLSATCGCFWGGSKKPSTFFFLRDEGPLLYPLLQTQFPACLSPSSTSGRGEKELWDPHQSPDSTKRTPPAFYLQHQLVPPPQPLSFCL